MVPLARTQGFFSAGSDAAKPFTFLDGHTTEASIDLGAKAHYLLWSQFLVSL